MQAGEQNPPDRQAAIVRVDAFDHMPGRIVTAGAAHDALAVFDELVVGLRLLPVQRADAPAVQGVVRQRLEAGLHLFLGQVEPELEDQRAFVTQHLFQTLGGIDALIEPWVLELAMDSPLKHLAVPIAKENTRAALGRQHSPVAPGRRTGQLLIGLLIKGTHFDQSRVHPLIEQLDRLTLAGPFDAVDQHDDRKTFLLLEFKLRVKQRFAQRRHFSLVGFFIDEMTDFSRFEHGWLPSRIEQD